MLKDIEYRELSGFKEFEECYELQKKVLGVADKDVLPPVFLNLLTRKFPRTGFALGAFTNENNKNVLIGFFLNIAGVEEKNIYGVILGNKPEYRKKDVGYKLLMNLRENALMHKIKKWYGIYESLEGNLGNLYINKFGMKGIKYEPEAYELPGINIPIDKVLIRWDLDSERVHQKIKGIYKKKNLEELLKEYPVATTKKIESSNKLLIQIPDDFLKLKQMDEQKALEWRMETRMLFTEYINKKNYTITEFYTRIINNKRENYYLLEKCNL